MAEAKPAATAKPNRLPLIILTVVLLVLSSWGVRRYLFSRNHVTTDNAQIDGHITIIAPKVQAFVGRVLVDDNQHVKVGDTLVVLDDRDLLVRLQQAEADLESAQTVVGSRGSAGLATSQLRATEAQAASSEAGVGSAQAAYKKAAADLERYRGLAAQHIIAAQQLDAAQAAFDAAAANLQAAEKQASAAGSQVNASQSNVRGADARLASARSAVDNAKLQLSYAYLLAPVSGVVARRNAETGALVQVGQSLMSIVPDSEVWVTANLKETQLNDVRLGDKAEFSIDAYPGRTFTGHIESLSPATGAKFALLPPDNATGNFTKVVQRVPVRIGVDSGLDAEHPLRPGMSADVTITTR
ncbi:MAG: HlyD family secretion protein [Gemmatimonadota bacterium]